MLVVWAILVWPLYLLWPVKFEVDEGQRLLRYRAKAGRPGSKALRFSEIRAIEVSDNPGGLSGKLFALGPSTQTPPKPGQHHLHLVLGSGERVVARNVAMVDQAELDELAQSLRLHVGR